MTGTVHVIK